MCSPRVMASAFKKCIWKTIQTYDIFPTKVYFVKITFSNVIGNERNLGSLNLHLNIKTWFAGVFFANPIPNFKTSKCVQVFCP